MSIKKAPIQKLVSRCPKCGAPIYMTEDPYTLSAKRVREIGEPTFTCLCRHMVLQESTPVPPYSPANPWVWPGTGPTWNGNGNGTGTPIAVPYAQCQTPGELPQTVTTTTPPADPPVHFIPAFTVKPS